MEKSARAVIIVNKQDILYIVSIKRTKYDEKGKITKEYYTIPGGHVEDNETFEETVLREIEEEVNVKINITKEMAHIYNEKLDREEVFYYATIKEGDISQGNGPEFSNPDLMRYGKYEIVYLPIKKLCSYNILPLEIKEKIIEDFK